MLMNIMVKCATKSTSRIQLIHIAYSLCSNFREEQKVYKSGMGSKYYTNLCISEDTEGTIVTHCRLIIAWLQTRKCLQHVLQGKDAMGTLCTVHLISNYMLEQDMSF